MSAPSVPAGPDGAVSIDGLLDRGSAGLLYFEYFLPLLARIGEVSEWTYTQLCARYDEQRGLDLAVLAADADALGEVIASADAQVDEQRRLCAILGRSWNGGGGAAALLDTQSDLARAEARVESMDELYQAMHTVVYEIGVYVRDKIDVIGSIDRSQVGGRSRASIYAIADFATLDLDSARGVGPVANAKLAAVSRGLPAVASIVDGRAGLDEAGLHAVQGLCRDWLHSVFVPAVVQTCRLFVDICSATDTAVRQALEVVAQTAEDMDDTAFPDNERPDAVLPGGEPECRPDRVSPTVAESDADCVPPRANSVPPDSPQPSKTVSVDAQPVSQSPATALPQSSTQPQDATPSMLPAASSPSAVTGSGGVDFPSAEKFAAAVEAAVEKSGDALAARIRSAIDDTLGGGPECASEAPPSVTPETASTDSIEPKPPSPAPEQSGAAAPTSGERGHLEAELDGHRARIALAHDGTVSLELGGPDGGSRRFELRVGPLGLPIVVETTQAPGLVPSVEERQPTTSGSATPIGSSPAVIPPDSGSPGCEPEAAPTSEQADTDDRSDLQPDVTDEPQLGSDAPPAPEVIERCPPGETGESVAIPGLPVPEPAPAPVPEPAPSAVPGPAPAADVDSDGDQSGTGARLVEAGPL